LDSKRTEHMAPAGLAGRCEFACGMSITNKTCLVGYDTAIYWGCRVRVD
jgi:hypothetical protein